MINCIDIVRRDSVLVSYGNYSVKKTLDLIL